MQVPELMNNKKKIIKLSDITPFRLITLATDQDYYNMIKNICYSNTPLSEKHKQLIVSEIETNNYEIMNHINLSSITQKETLIIITGELLNVFNSDQIKVYGFDLIENLKTMTDVLRLASYLSKGDVSLKENTLFKLKNSHRNFISKASEKIIKNNIKTYNSSNTNDDLLLNKEKWVKLAHCLHVGSKSNTYPLFFKSIHDLRNKTLNKSVNGQIEMLIEYLVKQNKRKNETEEDILNNYNNEKEGCGVNGEMNSKYANSTHSNTHTREYKETHQHTHTEAHTHACTHIHICTQTTHTCTTHTHTHTTHT
jgi:hypothetical protein